MDLERARGSWRSRGNRIDISGRIEAVDDINIHYVNVLDQTGKTFTCEIELEAELGLNLSIEIEGSYYGYDDDYDPPSRYSTHKSIHHIFSAEVIVRFDPKAPVRIPWPRTDRR